MKKTQQFDQSFIQRKKELQRSLENTQRECERLFQAWTNQLYIAKKSLA
ncbi:MAG: hypothetical protein GY909_09190 [Oligoflexia bacterium]|nr:hypothetical protein [Oligoflexia bacterium]